MAEARKQLETFRLPTNLKLALLWASLMSLYIYNDYFSMYLPGTIENMKAGRIGPLGEATDGVFVGVSMLLAIPALMIVLSGVLPPAINRTLNIMFGLAYTAVEALTFVGSRPFYQIVVAFEIAVTLTIVWSALRWPRATRD